MTADVNYCVDIEYNGNQTGADNFTATRTNLDTGAVDIVNATQDTSGYGDINFSYMFYATSGAYSDSKQWDQKIYLNDVLVRHYPLQGSACDVSGNDQHGSNVVGVDIHARQDEHHYNLENGFDGYRSDAAIAAGAPFEIEDHIMVPWRNGSPVASSVTDYTKIISSPPAKFYGGVCIKHNMCETMLRFPSGSVMDKSDSLFIVMDAIGVQTDGVAFDVDGDANGDSVDILVDDVAVESDVAVVADRFSQSITLDTGDGQVIKVRDHDDNDAYDTETINVLAVLTMDTPDLTAGVEGTITGTSTGDSVDVYYRVSDPEGSWELFEEDVDVDGSGDWEATGTVDDADDYDFKAEDSTNPDGYIQEDDVTVASGSLLLQIPSVDCDFTPKQTQIVPSSTKVIVAGSVAYTGGSPTIGGEALDSGLSEVVVCYDLDTQAVQWVGQPESGVSATSQGMSLYSNQLYVDTDNAYLAWTFNEVTERVYLKKWAISNGATVNALELNVEANDSNSNACAICGDDTYIYGVSSNVKLYGFKVVKSTFLKDSDKNDLFATGQTSAGSDNIALSVEGSTLYYATLITKADGSFVSKNSCTTAFASATEIERYITYDATTAWRSYMYGSTPLNRTMVIEGIDDAGGGYAELWNILSDKNSTELDSTKYNLCDSNSLVFAFYTTKLAKINQSTLAETWTVDYSGSYDVVKFIGVVHDGTSYWLVGETDGDFDGNNPTNTKSCLIFAKLDTDDGSI